MDVNIFEKLINEFSKVPKLEAKAPTYLEISGQPHFENVCSNILAFYFNTNECHGLKDLVLRSFIESINERFEFEDNFETIGIERELFVTDQKRIDIVVETSEIVVTIENKIFHQLINDLNIYKNSIKSIYPKKKYYFVVLSLKYEIVDVGTEFVAVTYESFFEKLKINLGSYFINSNNQYTTFLIDFIQTIENLTKKKTMNKQYSDFFISNKKEIEELIKETERLKSYLGQKVSDLLSVFENEVFDLNKVNSMLIAKWIWQKNTLVFEFDFNEKKIWLPFVIDYNQITGLIYVRKDKNNINENDELLSKLDLLNSLDTLKYNKEGRLIIYEKEIQFTEINIEEFANELIKIISKIKII